MNVEKFEDSLNIPPNVDFLLTSYEYQSAEKQIRGYAI